MSDAAIDRVHHDLKIIASLHVNDKIYVNDGMLCVLSPSVYNAVWRWARGDNRAKSLQTVDTAITEALSIAECCMERVGRSETDTLQWRRSSDEACRATVKRLYQELQAAVLGLRHLRITYNNDKSTSARIEVMREKTSERLSMIAKWLRSIGELRDEDVSSATSSPLFGIRAASSSSGIARDFDGFLAIEDLNRCIMLSEEALRS